MPDLASSGTRGLVGQSPEIASVRRLIEKASRTRLPVLLLGESGTGKEVAARAIFDANPHGRFVPIDCGSLVGTLMESELFGHTRGAFTGAVAEKHGLIELADGGTAFFDEIGDLPLEMQVKLLRLVQEKEFRTVGAVQARKVDLRIIAATHRDLPAEIRNGRFRHDLYYRLNVLPIRLPPLRDRKSDIPLLIEHFTRLALSRDVMETMMRYDWPGNVRELKHCLERMEAMQSDGAEVTDLPSALRYHRESSQPHETPRGVSPVATWTPPAPVRSIPDSTRDAILRALAETRGNRLQAASLLCIGRTTLYRKMKEYGMVPPAPAGAWGW